MEFGEYIGKSIISWLWYNPNYEERFGSTNIVCYIYPRVLANGDLESINAEEDFPENGRIEVFIQDGQSAKEVFEKFGSLVSVRLNRDIQPNYKGYNRYRVNYYPQPSNHANISDFTIERLSSKKFYQVLELNTEFSQIQKSHTLEWDKKPLLDCVLLHIGEFLYGPFEYTYDGNLLQLIGSKVCQYRVGEYLWSNYISKTALIQDQEGKSALRILPTNALAEFETSYDWISNEQLLIGLINTLKASNQYTRNQLRKIGESAQNVTEGVSDEPLTDERKQRLQALIQDFTAWSELADAVVETALNDDASCEVLADIAVTSHFEEIKEKLLQHEEIREHIADLKREETELQRKVESLQRREADLQNRVPAMEAAWENDPIVQERRMALAEYERKIKEARDHYQYEQSYQGKLDEALTHLIQQYQDKANQVVRLFDYRLLTQILKGTEISENLGISNQKESPEIARFNPAILHAPMSQDEIIDRVSSYIRENAGRKISRNEVINYLICISQGFITTFVGKPGTGKTTLCNLLAKSLGLSTGDVQNRFIEIPVERGWSSQRDFIGTYNPITKTMESGNPEVLDALKRLDYECDTSDQVAPFFILLDEANLSPIEHYWSVFLRNCDFNSLGNRIVTLGNGQNYRIPNHLRFLATINFDHTTEKLSQRFLDRSWMITLGYTEISEELKANIKNGADMIPYLSLQNAFCFSENSPLEMDEAILKKWNAIRTIFQGQHFPIMQRSLKMVRDYCAIACTCMDRSTVETQFAPLDYAFSEKILPALNGSGDLYRNLIYDLRRECAENMPLSAQHLERMQLFADTKQTGYRFGEL